MHSYKQIFNGCFTVNRFSLSQFCQYYLVKFCPHDLFVNTRADLGQCPKLHDDEAKRLYENARPGARKRQYEDDFLRFCNNMINEVDRKIQKGKQRLLLMNKGEGGPVYVSKFQEQLNNLNARIKKLLNEAEEAGHRGDVDQAQVSIAILPVSFCGLVSRKLTLI